MLRELFDDWDNDASWSKLSQHFIANEHREKQTQPMHNKLPCLLACLHVPCHSKPSSPPHVNQNYTTSTGLSPGGRLSPRLPSRTAFSCPSIMSAGDIQAWCDVAFTKGHVRHLRSVCISRTGSRHMGAGIGHYPGPQGDSMLWGFVSGILISLFQGACTEPCTVAIHVLMLSNKNWIWPSVIQGEEEDDNILFCFNGWTLLSHDALDSGDGAETYRSVLMGYSPQGCVHFKFTER